MVQITGDAYIDENIEIIHYWPYVRGIHRRPMDSPTMVWYVENVSIWRQAIMCTYAD